MNTLATVGTVTFSFVSVLSGLKFFKYQDDLDALVCAFFAALFCLLVRPDGAKK